MPFNRLRYFNKRVINRVTRRFARSARGPFALVRHVGRRSGKPYETPIMVEPLGDGVLIALTYGPAVDWYRNVLAVGRCALLWHGKDYLLDQPEPVPVHTALRAYPQPQRTILRLLGTRDFVRMRARPATPASAATPA